MHATRFPRCISCMLHGHGRAPQVAAKPHGQRVGPRGPDALRGTSGGEAGADAKSNERLCCDLGCASIGWNCTPSFFSVFKRAGEPTGGSESPHVFTFLLHSSFAHTHRCARLRLKLPVSGLYSSFAGGGAAPGSTAMAFSFRLPIPSASTDLDRGPQAS